MTNVQRNIMIGQSFNLAHADFKGLSDDPEGQMHQNKIAQRAVIYYETLKKLQDMIEKKEDQIHISL